jgi:2-(1,2-epoxy-1,2-dihydrophenyl)acetyl-CoA isomerase
MNRPAALNALSPQMLRAFETQVLPLARNPGVRAILLTGEGRGFCAGGDVRAMGGGGAMEPDAIVAEMRRTHGWLTALRTGDAILVTAVNGPAAGGGFGLALLGDVVLASDAAFFKVGFTDLGLAADFGLGWSLPRAVGDPRAGEILFSDRRITADEGERLGFVSRVLPQQGFAEAARDFARQMAGTPFGATLTKRLMRRGEAQAFADYLEAEAIAQAQAFCSEDFREGVTAFAERRPPKFHGR